MRLTRTSENSMHLELGLVGPESIPAWLDLGSVAVGAVFGATLGTSRKAPLIGVLLLAGAIGFGGGILRDLFLGVPINALTNNSYIITVAVAALVAIMLGDRLVRPLWVLLMLDALVMGLFVVIGTEKSLILNFPAGSAIFVGTVAAIGGGIIADLLTGELPVVMKRGPWQASIALACAIWFVTINQFHHQALTEISTIVLAVAIRGTTLWRGWEAPHADHLSISKWRQRLLGNSQQKNTKDKQEKSR